MKNEFKYCGSIKSSVFIGLPGVKSMPLGKNGISVPIRTPKKILVPARSPKLTVKTFKNVSESELFFSGSGELSLGFGSKSPTSDSGNMEFLGSMDRSFLGEISILMLLLLLLLVQRLQLILLLL